MTPYLSDPDFTLYVGDVRDVLATLPDESVDCVITSPPYWGLRDYSCEGQLGLEASPDEYVQNMVAVFREVRRVLSPFGTCWLNLGDSYAGSWGAQSRDEPVAGISARQVEAHPKQTRTGAIPAGSGLKPKDLVGIPWRVAFALQADGWWLRSEIIWAKPNPMPESVTDRPTKSHEQVFLLSKRPVYWFDQEAVREPSTSPEQAEHNARYAKVYDAHTERVGAGLGIQPGNVNNVGIHARGGNTVGRNVRSVWEIATQPYAEAHFATYPQELVRRCLLAGCPEWVCSVCGVPRARLVERAPNPGGISGRPGEVYSNVGRASTVGHGENITGRAVFASVETVGWSDCGHNAYRPGIVLDPFLGSGTTALVARHHGRHAVGIELNADYAALAAGRLSQLSLLA